MSLTIQISGQHMTSHHYHISLDSLASQGKPPELQPTHLQLGNDPSMLSSKPLTQLFQLELLLSYFYMISKTLPASSAQNLNSFSSPSQQKMTGYSIFALLFVLPWQLTFSYSLQQFCQPWSPAQMERNTICDETELFQIDIS